MEYREGTLGRVFVLKFAHGEDIKKALEGFLEKEHVETASLVFLGALNKGKIVAGPKKAVVPPEPNWVSFSEGWEVLGVGSVFPGKGPQIHMHGAMGKNRKVLAGCIRDNIDIFMVIEAFVFEIKGVKASKEPDAKTGLNLLRFL